MSVIEVELPDGTVVEFPEGTDTATMERALASFAKPKADFSGVSGQSSTVPAAEEPSFLDNLGRQAGLGARAAMRGAYSLPGMVLDPIMQATGQPTSHQAADLHADKLGLPRPEYASERVSGDITSALTGGGGVMAAGRQMATRAPGVAQGVGEVLSSHPRSQLVSLLGGSGAAGVTREQGGSQGQQTLAGLLGGLSPVAASTASAMGLRGLLRAGEAGRQRMAGNPETLEPGNIAKFRSLGGAEPSVGQATQRPWVQGLESLLAASPTSAPRMARFAERQADDIGAGLRDRGESMFRNASAERAGRAIERGVDTFAGNVKATRKALYWQADQHIPASTQIPLTRTQQTLSELTSLTPGAESTTAVLVNPRIAALAKTVGEDMHAARLTGQGGMPYSAVKELRSRIGEELSEFSLAPDRPTAQYKRLYAALSQDLEEAARKQGPAAEQAARRANDYTRASAERLEQIQRVVDKAGGSEKVFQAAMAGTKDGGTTLRAVMQSLPEEGQRAVTAAVVKRMGLATPGVQDAAGDVFSAQTFLTKWNNISPEARRALFNRHGPKFTRDMDKIAAVAGNIREGSKVFANPSGTANRAAALSYYGGLAGSLAAAPWTGGLPLALFVLGGGAANVTARAMTNPKFVDWLAKATEMPVSALPQQIVALKAVAEDDPDVAEVVESLEQPSQ